MMAVTRTRDYTSRVATDGGSTAGTISRTQAAAYASMPLGEYPIIRDLLRQFGLESIYDKIVPYVTGETSTEELEVELRRWPEYQQRFPQIFEREKAGLPPVSAIDVVNYERELGELFSAYGVPQQPGENLQDLTARLMVNDVSPTEAQARLAAQASFGRQVLDDPENTGYAQELLNLGATVYDIANFALDPTNTLEQVQRRLAAAEVANEANQRDYDLTAAEAMDLARQGVDQEQAARGFGELRNQSQVVDRLVGDTSDPISREQELAAVAGDVEAQAAIERSAQRRVAAFQVGGQFATDEEGFGGLR